MWGGEKLGRPILSPLQNVGIFLFILSTFGLCYSFAVSELSWLTPSRESSFQTNTFICNCRVGKDWAGPFFPPSLIFRSSIDRFVFWFMLLFLSILTFMKELYQSENQGPFFPPSKNFRSFYWSVTIVVFRFMLLFHCILTLMNDRFQRENQVFKPNILFVLLHCWVGKDWAGPFFPPPPPPHPS